MEQYCGQPTGAETRPFRNAASLHAGAEVNIQLSKNRNPIKGQGVLPCLLVYYLLSGNLKLANKAVHGTNHAKHLEPLDFRCTVWRTGTASGIGTAFFLRMIEMINPSGHETWRL